MPGMLLHQGATVVCLHVGIGTAAPRCRLQIVSDVNGIGFDPSDGSPNAGYIRFGDNTGWKLHFGRSQEGSGVRPANSGTAGVLMTIQDNGNVGIGTMNPSFYCTLRACLVMRRDEVA
jgi:hypothetical protein